MKVDTKGLKELVASLAGKTADAYTSAKRGKPMGPDLYGVGTGYEPTMASRAIGGIEEGLGRAQEALSPPSIQQMAGNVGQFAQDNAGVLGAGAGGLAVGGIAGGMAGQASGQAQVQEQMAMQMQEEQAMKAQQVMQVASTKRKVVPGPEGDRIVVSVNDLKSAMKSQFGENEANSLTAQNYMELAQQIGAELEM